MERYNIYIVILCIFAVTSLVEVWIEITTSSMTGPASWVTSLVEVWIEMRKFRHYILAMTVTSLVEVWIEIFCIPLEDCRQPSHFPCGSVD